MRQEVHRTLEMMQHCTCQDRGESELCQVETLGLQNLTVSRQRSDLAACHTLYAVAFRALGAISMPFLLCGTMALLVAAVMLKGLKRPKPDFRRSLMCVALLEVLGAVIVWLPSWLFPSISLAVAAGLAPIHAYFISITVGHLAISVSGAESGASATSKAAHIYKVLYQGYCAASRVELCLSVGSISLLLLFWCFVLDVFRIIASVSCWQPKLDVQGSQLWQMFQQWRER
ncbi:unnamed protein product [Durusdinium trenchii]|uniref:Uncharacterized protein n=2 Tax=Durusdinium trenchii TaxID=1381693 RepID=A0ABP0JQ80_9DINO